MARRDHEPIAVAEFAARSQADEAWGLLTDAGIAGAVITDNPPWGAPIHRVQVARIDAANAVRIIAAGHDSDVS